MKAMKVYGLKTRLIKEGDDICKILIQSICESGLSLKDGDVLVVTSKAVSTAEGRIVHLENIKTRREAREIGEKYSLKPEFMELIMREADEILGGVKGAVYTYKKGLLIANAGIDSSNAPENCVILHPVDPHRSAEEIRRRIMEETGKKVAVIIADSRVQPSRTGNVGFALAVSGLDPVIDERGKKDIYGKEMKLTRRAVADNLVCAAELFLCERNEMTPFALIRNAPIKLVENADNEKMIINRNEDIFFAGLREYFKRKG